MATVVTIGRNVFDTETERQKPMDELDWLKFQDSVAMAVEGAVGRSYFIGRGLGESEQWGVEDAFCIIAPEPEFGETWSALKVQLAALGRAYHQDAVAVQCTFTAGATQFI